MSKLEQKLHEFSCRKEHEKFLTRLSPSVRELFEAAEKTTRKEAISNLAMSSWVDGKCKPSRSNVLRN
jgi:hypothetical protein